MQKISSKKNIFFFLSFFFLHAKNRPNFSFSASPVLSKSLDFVHMLNIWFIPNIRNINTAYFMQH